MGTGTLASLYFLGTFLISLTTFWGGVILSGDIIFYDLDREELPSIPGDKRLMSLGVEDIGVPGVFWVPGVVSLGVSSKLALWVPIEVVFWVPNVSIFTILCLNPLRPKPYL